MEDQLKQVRHFKLLTLDRGGAFTTAIMKARNGNTKHRLQHRLLFSYLGFRARKKQGASIRRICGYTGLHARTVTTVLADLGTLVAKRRGKWFAQEPPVEFFRAVRDAPHWLDRMAYTMLYLPRRGAKVPTTTRRFGINHAVLYSYLRSRAKDRKLSRFTLAGQAAMLDGMNPKTVHAILQDLVKTDLIAWDGFVLTLQPFTDDHLALFEPATKEEREPLPEATAVPSLTEYRMRNDRYDECRALCKGLMPQADAEAAILKAKLLSDEISAFETQLNQAKDQHRKNVLKGKVGKGDFGAYFNRRMQTRLDEHEKVTQEWERNMERQQRYLSPDPEQREAEEMEKEKAKADPMHPLHRPGTESILDRVSFPPACGRRPESLSTDLRRHCRRFVEGQHLPLQEEKDLVGALPDRIMRAGLAKVNHYYGQAMKGTPEELAAAIDAAMAEHGAPPFPFFPVVISRTNSDVPRTSPSPSFEDDLERQLERMEIPEDRSEQAVDADSMTSPATDLDVRDFDLSEPGNDADSLDFCGQDPVMEPADDDLDLSDPTVLAQVQKELLEALG